MKTLNLLFVLLSLSLLSVSCEKVECFPEEMYGDEHLDVEAIPTLEGSEIVELEDALVNATSDSELEERGGTLIHSASYIGNQGQWVLIPFNRVSFPNPELEKIRAVVTPYTGSVTLYMYGYDPTVAAPWRRIRRSTGSPVQEATMRTTDLMTQARNETRGYVAVYMHTNNVRFKLDLFIMDVDCQEYPSIEPIVTLEYNPVCGCDGSEYANPSSAFAAGVTAYIPGSCNNNNIICNLDTGLGETKICDDFEGYDMGLDLDPQAAHWEVWPGGSDARLIELQGGGPGVGGFTERYMELYTFQAIRSDVLLKLGNANSGIHRVAWKMLVTQGKSAYFNIQRFETAGTEFGEQFFFYDNGIASIRFGNSTITSFRYTQGQWIDMELIVDLDARRYTLVMDGAYRITWTNPYGSKSLGAIDFFAYGNNPLFSVDDVCYEANLSRNPYGTSANAPEQVELEEGEFLPTLDKTKQDEPNM